MILVSLLIAVNWLLGAAHGFWWGLAFAHWSKRREGGRYTGAAHRLIRRTRRWMWLLYPAKVATDFLDNPSWGSFVRSFVLYTAMNALAWWATKDVDDDFWKKLIEKGTGVVERIGNRLRVVVPAPAGA